jgi:tetratricopeptide (TPR) repeat protein
MRIGLCLAAAFLLTSCGTPAAPATPAPESAEEYIERGESLAEQGLYPEAIDHFSGAIEMEPENGEAFFLRGRAHYDYAVKLSVETTGQPPEGVPFLPQEVTEQMELAVADYTSAVELSPLYAKAYNNRGNARATLGDLEGAVEDYDQALELDGSLDLTYFNRGAIHYQVRNYAAAIVDLEMYLELVPDAEDRARVEALIEEMKGASAP